MTRREHTILAAAVTVCVLAALSADCCAKLNGQQESLSGVKLLTVHADCCDLAKEAELDEEEIRSNIANQLEAAGIKVVRPGIWETLPGRCRFRASVRVYKPPHLDTLMYNLKVEFVQAVTLARLPETQIDAATWERTWFAHGSEKRLTEVVPYNLRVMTASFIRDYRQANPQHSRTSVSNSVGDGSATTSNQPAASKTPEGGFIASKTSDVFHKFDCRWAQNISAENLVRYRTRDEAVKAGKRPCKFCSP